jgi:putative ABC transport system substrate-binding protein
MRRRQFIGLIGGAAAAWLPQARAQQVRKVIGILFPGSHVAAPSTSLDAFYQKLNELGYIEGKNTAIERRYGDWNFDRLSDQATELVRLKVDVIVAFSTTAARAAKQATNTIPIVAGTMADPVGDGLVASLARPGGNVTGTTFVGPELVAKRLGLLKEAVPGLFRLAGLWQPGAYGESTMKDMLTETEAVARALGMQLQLEPAPGPDDIDVAFSAMARERAGAFIVLPSPMLVGENRRIVGLAAKGRLPAMYQVREFVEAGGLMSYGANLAELNQRSAAYVDKILKGAKPADLPVEQPTRFEFVINLKTARTLGLELPATLLSSADEVIE